MKYKQGQQAIIGLLLGFILVATFSILLKPLLTFIDIGINATNNITNSALIQVTINTIPVFLGLVVLVAIVLMIIGR